MLNATPLVRLYAKHRINKLRRFHPARTQEHQLLSLLQKAKETQFGKEHQFSSIRTVSDYQRLVPLRRYEDFWNTYWKPNFPRLTNITWPGTIPYFPVSSGTTSGTTKFIPCSQEMIRSNNKAGLDLITHHLANRPKSRILGGNSFMLGGSTALKEETPGIYSGDLSGISVKALPWWAKLRYFPPPELALLANWEEKIEKLAHASLSAEIRMLSGVPSWMLIFIDRLRGMNKGSELHEIYPNLEMIVHGGVNFAPYHDRFSKMLEKSHAELREVYPASEGFFAIADRGYGEGLRLNIDHDLFFEFVPLEELSSSNPTRHWAENIELDVNYAVILTTCAGLWSYIIGDTVRFVDRNPLRLLVTGRTSYFLSAFGEHLIGEEIENSITEAAQACGQIVSDYSVGALYPKTPEELGGHLYIVEFVNASIPEQAQEIFLRVLDENLCRRNEDYEAHRAKGFGLNPPQLLAVPPGTFTAWMKQRGKLGGQNKVPRIINDQDLFLSLRQFSLTA